MCQILGISEKYFFWSTFEHSRCHIIYAISISEAVCKKISIFIKKFRSKNIFFGCQNFSITIFENFHENFQNFRNLKIFNRNFNWNFRDFKNFENFHENFRKSWSKIFDIQKYIFRPEFLNENRYFLNKPMQNLIWHK